MLGPIAAAMALTLAAVPAAAQEIRTAAPDASPSPPAAAAQPVTTVGIGETVDWSAAEDPNPAYYRAGPLSLTLRGAKDADALVQPVLTVEMSGFAAVDVQGSLSRPGLDHRIIVGAWDGERPYVLFQSFTGGAHCCNMIRLVVPEGGRLSVADLGIWDGDYLEELPTDLDGDGRLDFVFRDDALLYAFASYAESFAPPLVLNVVDGQVVDVSDHPGFRPMFLEAMADARQSCASLGLPDSDGPSSNGACAGFVASAARAGRFDEAWAQMLAAYDRDSDWPLPQGCRTRPAEGECPAADVIAFDDYPDALRAFLVRQGYISR